MAAAPTQHKITHRHTQRKTILLTATIEFIQSLRTTSIEVYEWNEADVRKKRLSNSPSFGKLTKQRQDLTFNGFGLAHAVVKADYLDRRSLFMPGVGFLLQAQSILDIRASPITLKDGASKAMNDFSLTSLSGRVGQGLAILYGQSLGMKFAAHLRSHVASLSVASSHLNNAMADFLFANEHQSALFESKASFSLQDNDPSSIKSVLKQALEKQIDPWMGYLTPAPNNGYVVYSCLRESAWKPSAMFVVDPPERSDNAPGVPLTPDQVRRENYGAWLRAMGLTRAARQLVMDPRAEPGAPREVPFILQEIGGRTYAFRDHPLILYKGWGWPHAVVGLDWEVLQAISKALSPQEVGRSELRIELPASTPEQPNEVSIFPDGSIFGHVRFKPVDVEWLTL